MEKEQLSPHDETTLFQLVEIERSLPREQQSRRFNVKVFKRRDGSSYALIRAATASTELTRTTDSECFYQLSEAGFISGGRVRVSYDEGDMRVSDLDTVQLMGSAFEYYDEKHDFPTSLADERRQFVDSTISTAYPEVVAHLKKAYDAIWVQQPGENWSSVARDCQEALRSFAVAVYKEEYASKLGEELPSSADFEGRLEQTIRAREGGKELRDLLDKLNRYANARRHDPGTTRKEAKRCVLLTYLLVGEIWDVLASSEDA